MGLAVLSAEGLKELDGLLGRYPTRRAALLPLFHLVQREHGFISAEAEEWIAERLDLTPVKVHEVLTFYTMLRTRPAGRWHLQVCRTLSCQLRGAEKLLEHLHGKLGLERENEPTPDGRFSFQEVECLGACGNAPVVQVNDDYHMDLDVSRLDALLARLD